MQVKPAPTVDPGGAQFTRLAPSSRVERLSVLGCKKRRLFLKRCDQINVALLFLRLDIGGSGV